MIRKHTQHYMRRRRNRARIRAKGYDQGQIQQMVNERVK